MSFNTVQPSGGVPQSSRSTRTAAAGDGLPVASERNTATDTVHLSEKGRFLANLPEPVSPTPENLQKLSDTLSSKLKDLFRGTGIDMRRPVEFDVDPGTGAVGIRGERPDARTIVALLARNPDIGRQMHDVAATSSHVVLLAESARAGQTHQATRNAAEMSCAVARYVSTSSGSALATDLSPLPNSPSANTPGNRRAAAIYAPRPADTREVSAFSLVFDGTELRTQANGKSWMPALDR